MGSGARRQGVSQRIYQRGALPVEPQNETEHTVEDPEVASLMSLLEHYRGALPAGTYPPGWLDELRDKWQ